MALLSRNFLVSIMLALSDFASFVISMYIAMGILFLSINNHDAFVDTQQIQGWIALHWLLAACCLLCLLVFNEITTLFLP